MKTTFFNSNIASEVICKFLAVFSRMEFALKASIKYAIGNEERVSANWDSFG